MDVLKFISSRVALRIGNRPELQAMIMELQEIFMMES